MMIFFLCSKFFCFFVLLTMLFECFFFFDRNKADEGMVLFLFFLNINFQLLARSNE